MLEPYRVSQERLVLEKGRTFTSTMRPPGRRKGWQKRCFQNATLLALDQGYDYVEGYLCPLESGSPFLHAWCAVGNVAIDPTLRNPEAYEFFGIIIPIAILHEWLFKTRTYGIIREADGVTFLDQRLRGGVEAAIWRTARSSLA